MIDYAVLNALLNEAVTTGRKEKTRKHLNFTYNTEGTLAHRKRGAHARTTHKYAVRMKQNHSRAIFCVTKHEKRSTKEDIMQMYI